MRKNSARAENLYLIDGNGFFYRAYYAIQGLTNSKGGENIYPTEIENVLYNHPGVAAVAVIGVPHERWGETPRAFVVAREAAKLTEAELIDFTRERLARYKCPTSVAFVTALPQNASGKILKKEMRDPQWLKEHS